MNIYQYEYFNEYITIFMIAHLFEAIHKSLTGYLNIIEKSWISIIISLSGLVLHIVLSYIFVILLEFGIFGAAIVVVIVNISIVLTEFGYILIFKPNPESFFFFTVESFDFNDLLDFMKYYLTILPIGISLFWSEEIQAIFAFTLGKFCMTSFVILQNIASVLNFIICGSAIGASTCVGLFIGERKIHKIKVVLYIAIVFSNSLILLIIMFLVIFRNEILSGFINDKFILEYALTAFPAFCMFLILQTNSYLFEFFLRSCGYIMINIITQLFSYFVLMIGLSVIFTKILNLNVLGLWLSHDCAELTCLVVFVITYFVVDLEASIIEIIKEEAKEQHSEEEEATYLNS